MCVVRHAHALHHTVLPRGCADPVCVRVWLCVCVCAYQEPITYRQALVEVLQKDGVPGLLGRGLATRLATNGAQVRGAMMPMIDVLIDLWIG